MITKKFGIDFHSPGGALTLNVNEVCAKTGVESGIHQRKHADGWIIRGKIREDYFVWVNDFRATHPEYGRVWGDFEAEVYADSEEGFAHFWEHHEPRAWDRRDI